MSGETLNVLLLEDDEVDAQLVKRAMSSAGLDAELHWVTLLSEARTALADRRFDLVLSDLFLPDCRGRDTIAQLREAAAEVPIVVLTTIDDRDLGVALLGAGAQDYIPKDFLTGDVLGRAVRHAVQREQLRVDLQRLLQQVRQGQDLLEAKNRKLEKLYKQAHEFVDNVSHEFRTPLTVIKEYTSIVCDGLAGEVTSEQVRMLNVVEDRSNDLNTMVDDMLDTSKLEAGLLGAWRKRCHVTDVLSHISATLDRKAQVKKIQLEYDLAPDLPELYCDAEKVSRVITNLAVNAIKFCGDPGVVRIAATSHCDSPDVTFSVTDNGPGIDEQGVQRMFERFQQLGTSSRGSAKGFGLGLAIAKELVDLNFGRIYVESELEVGSTFHFTVPKNDPQEVMRRYLHHVVLNPDCLPTISLIAARIEPSSESATKGIEGFLNYLLRRNDLLLPTAPCSWLLALPTDKQELDSYFKRSTKAWEDANRNRPYGPLPRVDYELLDTWRLPEDQDAVIHVLAQHCSEVPIA